MLIKQNKFGLKCLKVETQLIYANLEAFVYILNNLAGSQTKGTTDVSWFYIQSENVKWFLADAQSVENICHENFSTWRKLCS